MSEALVSARGLAKKYGDFVAVDSIDFDVEHGEAFGFLGPNGAGKSTTMRMIGCVSPASAGSLQIFGMDAAADGRKIRARLGVVPQLDTLDKELSVMENLVLYGRYFDIPRAECRRRAKELLEFVQLSERADSVVEQLSGGMMRRLSITRSLINQPGPAAARRADDRSRSAGAARALGSAVSTEARRRDADHHDALHGRGRATVRSIGRDGRRTIVATGSPRSLIEQYSTKEVLELRFTPNGDGDTIAMLGDMSGIGERIEVLPDRTLVYADDGEAALAAVHGRGVKPISSLVRRSSLEDVFLHLTGRTLVD